MQPETATPHPLRAALRPILDELRLPAESADGLLAYLDLLQRWNDGRTQHCS